MAAFQAIKEAVTLDAELVVLKNNVTGFTSIKAV
jgi:hypothetical protein